jgi:hypothetical protein
MRISSNIILFVMMACGDSDKNITTTNQAPEANITSHQDGDTVPEGVVVLFTGAVSDTSNPLEDLRVTWYADQDILCEETVPEVDATTRCEGVVGANVSTITLAVRDPDNARDDAIVNIVVIETETPEAVISNPITDGIYYANDLITFEGLLSDGEDAATDLTAYWTSSVDGELTAVDATPNSDGEITGYGSLTEGQHVIELHVEDTTGKTNKDSLVIEVSPANSAPTCAIVQPVTNSAGAEGDMVTFQGEVSDPDIPASDLAVTWSSDKDGEIGSSTPNVSGVVTFPYDALSMNTHVVSMTVRDDAGETCVADVLYTVGSAPSITLDAPLTGDLYDEGDSITFIAQVLDNEDAAGDLAIEWSSSIDGVFSNQQAASTGTAQFNINTLTYGNHDITVTVTDTTGLYAEALTQIVINGLPTQPTVTITPNPAYSSDSLVANATGSTDPEGSAVTYDYEWLLNGSSSGYTGSSLASTVTTKGDNWTVRATPNDGTTSGPFAEDVVVIVNALPTASNVSISPTNPSPQDTLTCSYTATDADGDPVTVDFQWTMAGNILSSTTDTLVGPFQQGDIITCTVTPYDGTDYGTPVDDTVTISNTVPVISSLTVTPATVYTDDVIQATATATDADGDPLTYSWDWYVDDGSGFTSVQTNTGLSSDSLDGVYHFDKDDQVYVTLTVSDGSTTTSQTSSTIIIQNTAPSAYNVLISPVAPVAGLDDLECIAQGNDVDGDTVTFTYAWEVNGSATTYISTIIPTADIADGEVWECIVTPNDGTVDGSTNSALVTVGADVEGATGVAWCASAGAGEDVTGNQFTSCLSETGVAGEETTDPSSYTLQPGSIFVFSPE